MSIFRFVTIMPVLFFCSRNSYTRNTANLIGPDPETIADVEEKQCKGTGVAQQV